LSKGFTLIETLIALGIFVIIATGVYFSYSNLLEIFSASYLNLTALSALDNELEIAHNMPYSDLGVQGGSPAGVIVSPKNVTYGNINFVVTTVVRNIDDPFDGLQGGNPDDTAPADYKLVQIEITCPACPRFIPARSTTTIAPPGLETVTKKGTLIVKALNASGQPISGANVSIVNTKVNPTININDITDVTGVLKLVDIATSSAGYSITVTKSGYSTDRTYPPGGVSNPNPLKPDATVLSQKVTEISFVVDLVSTLNVGTQDEFCAGTGNIDFLQTGQKLIGTNPNVLKYSVSHTTDAGGDLSLSGLEFDTYNFQNQDPDYELSGFSPIMPIAVDPNGTYSLTWLMALKNPSAVVITVKDKNTGQLINDAEVELTKSGFADKKYTGRKFLTHTDWSNGQYDSKISNLEADSPAGELHIVQVGGKYASMSDEWLISKTIDFGTQTVTFYNLLWNPVSQPPQAGSNSLKIQIATNNDDSNWNFIGPDGTANSYYTSSDIQLHSSHNNNRYLRYKIILRTDNQNYTPSLQDLTLHFHSSCVFDGQVYFSGLNQATYKITVEKTGYKKFTDTGVKLDSSWKDYRMVLTPL